MIPHNSMKNLMIFELTACIIQRAKLSSHKVYVFWCKKNPETFRKTILLCSGQKAIKLVWIINSLQNVTKLDFGPALE